ncbi:MAG: hypothetical protein HRT37_25890 [Alteromonadaceae bacterium]|nr:hypothetical protein [Alteromonadaceae bacterium]
MKHFKEITVKEVSLLICDGCSEKVEPSDYTFHEFISVSHSCGYGSIHGDGKQFSIDLCQQCFADMCDDSLTITEPTYEDDEELDENTMSRLAARNILLAKKITNKEEEAIVLKRVNMLWDAQHISAEPNELYQLMDLVFAYQGISRD